jgi:AmmeMemoRadiSam system protein B/AmmeMemoRadiSam system protein A
MRARRPGIPMALLVLLLCWAGCGAEGGDDQLNGEIEETGGGVRSPVVAGMFYPGNAETLTQDVDAYLDAAETAPVEGVPIAIIAPHAGYVYSGGVAARAYVHVRGVHYDTVIVVAPSHRVAFGLASVFGGSGYATPLGVVRVDRELADAIAGDSDALKYVPRAHSDEHSLEVQVPFLQRTLGDFSIVPIVMGDQRESSVRFLAGRITEAVAAAKGKSVLLVASTDLSHYHTQDAAVELDKHVMRAVGDFDPEGLLASLSRGECEACGGGPAAAVMMAARELGATASSVTGYATSGDVTGDKSQVVGYLSAVLYGPRSAGRAKAGSGAATGASGSGEGEVAVAPYEGLTDDERAILLVLARRSIEAALAGEPAPEPEATTQALRTECGAFVTLEKRGALRGCIGYISAARPLVETVSQMAVQAAFHDPRFPPVTKDEFDELTLEISVLSPLVPVSDVSEIEVGRDGLLIRDGARSGLLLPQVATDHGWDRETFLEHTCLKAGLPPDSWKVEGVTILRFTADVFGEEEARGGP